MELTPSKRTPSDQHHHEKAKALGELGPQAKLMLRHLDTHGSITARPPTGGTSNPVHMAPHPPAGISARDAYGYLEQCATKSLITPTQTLIQTGGIYPIPIFGTRRAHAVISSRP